MQGSISISLVSFEKTINQYKDHFNKYRAGNSTGDDQVQLKHESRLGTLQEELEIFKTKFHDLKKIYNEQIHVNSFIHPNTSYDGETIMNKRNVSNLSAMKDSSERTMINSAAGLPLYEGLRKEESMFERGNAQLDRILHIGQESLDNIMEQNKILQKAQTQMIKSLTTLGVSKETIDKINKRVFKDKFIFWISLTLMFVGFYFVLRWTS